MIVLDASVLVEAVTEEGRRGEAARALLDGPVAVPDVAFVEAFLAIGRQHLGGAITPERFVGAVAALDSLPVSPHESRRLLPRMAELAESVGAYDAAYVALAESLGTQLVTTDQPLARAHGPRCEVRLLA